MNNDLTPTAFELKRAHCLLLGFTAPGWNTPRRVSVMFDEWLMGYPLHYTAEGAQNVRTIANLLSDPGYCFSPLERAIVERLLAEESL